MAGKADWSASGLPTEGTLASVPRIGDIARRDVPTCMPDDPIGDVQERVRRLGADTCVVVNERNVVLGRLRKDGLEADPELSAQLVMEPGPIAYRPNEPAKETAEYLAERGVSNILVTTSDGELVGLFRRDDVLQRSTEKATEGKRS
ncbi:MAG: CBS domain-containing protein [Chloroflexi bacterium]|nr:CBS domain-containing protein [Chloroflexota bacterium]